MSAIGAWIGWLWLAACGGGDDGRAGRDAAAPPDDGLVFEPIEWEPPRSRVTALGFVPGTMEMLVLERDGGVFHYAIEGDAAVLLGSFVAPGVHSDLDCGLLSIAFDPGFGDNRFVYLGTCTSMQESAILRVVLDPDDYERIAASAVEIFAAGDPRAPRPWHNVGSIGFEPDGTLWALFGDKTVDENGQDTDDDLGALIRIVPSRDPGAGGSTPAEGNPWLDGGGSPNVYAYGLRSPWRGARDHLGRVWIGDVGAQDWEEVNVVTEPGQNFGWADHEGPCERDCAGVTDPLIAWERDGDEPYLDEDPDAAPTSNRVVWVGPEVTEVADDPYGGRLAGKVLFGDFCVGFVRAVQLDEAGRIVSDEHLTHLAHLSALEQAPDGHLYGATFGSCVTSTDDQVSQLYRLVRTAGP